MIGLVPLLCSLALAFGKVAKTPFGRIQGFQYSTENGFSADVFLGIRFAQPPIEHLRFEKPLMVEPWSEIFDATSFGPSCYTHHRGGLEDKKYSEDCLSINVIVPSEKPDTSLPIIVYVHGGGYASGNAEIYGYKKATETFVSNRVIFVSLQYRVGFLGFLSTGDQEIAGNLGHWDQALALKFVREILPSLGGDVDQITVMGHSAGSSSITALLASPHTYDLFDQAIQLSGSGVAEFAFSENVVKESSALAAELGCEGSSVKQCLQDKTIDEIWDAMTTLGGFRNHSSLLKFHPRFDGDFFPDRIDVLLKNAPKKNTIQGLASEECFLFTIGMSSDATGSLYIKPERRPTFSKDDISNFINYTFTVDQFGREDSEYLNELALDFYADAQNMHNSSFYIRRITEFSSDFMFNIPVYQEVQLKASQGWNTYFYVIDHVSEATKDPSGHITGVVHGGELRFILEFYGQEEIPLSDEDKRFQKHFIDALINFATHGTPSTETLSWLPVTAENTSRHIRLNSKPEMGDAFFRKEAAEFWLKELPKAVGFDQVRKLLPALQETTIQHGEL